MSDNPENSAEQTASQNAGRPARAPLSREARARRQRMRSIAIALALGAAVLMFYLVTIVRLGANVSNGRF